MLDRLRRSPPHKPDIFPSYLAFRLGTARPSKRRAITAKLGPVLHAASLSSRAEEQLHEAARRLRTGQGEEGD
jgi:hypothetical protein